MHKQEKHKNPEDKKLRIIRTAAKLIKSDVKSLTMPNEDYPVISDIGGAVSYIPNTLQLLLRTVFAGKETDIKLASINQSIMQAIRPIAELAPLQIGLRVQMHHHFASRYLIDTPHNHGFSSSYAEVKRFE